MITDLTNKNCSKGAKGLVGEGIEGYTKSGLIKHTIKEKAKSRVKTRNKLGYKRKCLAKNIEWKTNTEGVILGSPVLPVWKHH